MFKFTIVLLLGAMVLVAAEPPVARQRFSRTQQRQRQSLPSQQQQQRRRLPSARLELVPTPYPSAQALQPARPFVEAATAPLPSKVYGAPAPQLTYGAPQPQPQLTYGAPQQTYGPPAAAAPEPTTETLPPIAGQPEDFGPHPDAEEFLPVQSATTVSRLVQRQRNQKKKLQLQHLEIASADVPTINAVPAINTVPAVAAVNPVVLPPATPIATAAAVPVATAVNTAVPVAAAAIATPLTAAAALPLTYHQPTQPFTYLFVNQPFAYTSQFQSW